MPAPSTNPLRRSTAGWHCPCAGLPQVFGRPGVGRIDLQRGLKQLDGLGDPVLPEQNDAQVDSAHQVAGIQTNGLLVFARRFIQVITRTNSVASSKCDSKASGRIPIALR